MLDLKEEAKFRELKDKCRELKVPAPPEIFIGLQVHENGVLVFDDKQRGHSWTRNFWNSLSVLAGQGALSGAVYGAGYRTQKYTSGAIAIPSPPVDHWYSFLGTIGSAARGIVVGTGDTAFSVEQYGMATLIAHGGTAGTFGYAAEPAIASAYTAGTKTWTATRSRIFNNNSGGSITVKETGLYVNNWFSQSSSGTLGPVCLERSVLSPTVAVANGAQLTVTYEISTDFSAID